MRFRFCAAIIALAATLAATPIAATDPPKLAVVIVVDQMRADYVDRFQSQWSSGLKRMVTKGAWFTRAAYPYLDTVTCAGHATIGTGAFPATHGVFQNAWFDRANNVLVTCTQDASVTAVPYGKPVTGSESASKLLVPTFAEEMHRQLGSRVVSVSLKARSAIMLAGHAGDAVTWLSDALDGWETSTAFASAPVPEVAAFVGANAIEADYGKSWTRLLPETFYADPDAGLGEAPPLGWTRRFPHALVGEASDKAPTAAYYQQWERSPFADAYLGRMAAALTESMRLGQGSTTDVLMISFSSPDLLGHAFGPRSQEIQDMYAHLDKTIGTLLDRLDALVGAGQYVVALSADHGVTPIPEQLEAEGKKAGRIDTAKISEAIETAAQDALGPGKYVRLVVGNDVYFQPGMFERLTDSPKAIEAVMQAAAKRPGIGSVFRADQLPPATTSRSSLLNAAALSYVHNRGGDLILAPKPGWVMIPNGATHGSANADDQRVPILLFGKGVKPGRFSDAATPADVAPTLADICGITLSHAQGTPLRAARR